MKFRTRSNRRRLMRALVLGLATAAIAVPAASAGLNGYPDRLGDSQPRQVSDAADRGSGTSTPAVDQRQISDAVDRGSGPAVDQSQRALEIRSEALNQKYGVSSSSRLVGHRDYADGRIPNVTASDTSTRLVSDDFEWGTLAIGVALGLMFSMFAAMTVGRRGRMAHS